MRSLRLGESSWLSINNSRRQTSPGGGKGRREGGEGEKKREMTEREREKKRRLVISVVSPPSPFMVSRVSRGKRKGGRRSGNTCPECVPDTVARGDERKIGAAHRSDGREAFEIT